MIIWISTILFSLDGYTLLFPMLGQNLHDFTPFSPDVGGTRAIPIPIMMDEWRPSFRLSLKNGENQFFCNLSFLILAGTNPALRSIVLKELDWCNGYPIQMSFNVPMLPSYEQLVPC